MTRLSLYQYQHLRRTEEEKSLPNYHGAWPPSETGLNILAPGNVFIQEFEEVVALLLLEANDVPRKLGIDE